MITTTHILKIFFIYSIVYACESGAFFTIWNFIWNTFFSTYYNSEKKCLASVISDVQHSFDNNVITKEKVAVKYEDKYLAEIRKMNKEWDFKVHEVKEQTDLAEKLFNETKEKVMSRIDDLRREIKEINTDAENDVDSDVDSDVICEDEPNTTTEEEGKNETEENSSVDKDDEEKAFEELIEELFEEKDDVVKLTYEERCEIRENKLKICNKELDELVDTINSQDFTRELLMDTGKQSFDHIVSKRIDKLTNCFVMETTPLGNALMIYNKDRESFAYYSDANIPYRYLEPISRKYVKMFNCRPLYIDMEDELKFLEEKWDREQELKRMKTEEDVKRDADLVAAGGTVALDKGEDGKKKKSVFAKLKSYNKDAGGKISMAAPPKNSIPNNQGFLENKENAKILLKERANRYTHEGKFANFSFLKKVEPKVFNKKLGLTFAEFKSSTFSTFEKSGAKC